ncbi:DsbA family protein [Aneurinibacillus sp. BA2021]|nr:DsbA family protein [Aneurinibacillus sp. BA2021]
MGKKHAYQLAKHQRLQKEAAQKKKMQRLMGYTLGVILLACIGLIAYGSLSGSQSKTPESIDAREFRYEAQPVLGAKDAPVKIVEFADFKCPACRHFEQTMLPQLQKDFIDSGIAQLYFINYPIVSPEADSRTAAMAGEAVYSQNPQAFWPFYRAVYASQGDERETWATADALVQIAKEAKVNVDYAKLKADIESQTFAKAVRDDEAIVKKLGIGGTPTIYINGQALPVDATFDYAAIKEIIQKAKERSGQ